MFSLSLQGEEEEVEVAQCAEGQYFGGKYGSICLSRSFKYLIYMRFNPLFVCMFVFFIVVELALVTHNPRAASAYAVGVVRCAGNQDCNKRSVLRRQCSDINRNIKRLVYCQYG